MKDAGEKVLKDGREALKDESEKALKEEGEKVLNDERDKRVKKNVEKRVATKVGIVRARGEDNQVKEKTSRIPLEVATYKKRINPMTEEDGLQKSE